MVYRLLLCRVLQSQYCFLRNWGVIELCSFKVSDGTRGTRRRCNLYKEAQVALDLCTSGHKHIVGLLALCYETCASRKVILRYISLRFFWCQWQERWWLSLCVCLVFMASAWLVWSVLLLNSRHFRKCVYNKRRRAFSNLLVFEGRVDQEQKEWI